MASLSPLFPLNLNHSTRGRAALRAALFGATLLLTGCAQTPQADSGPLPVPSLDGPVVVAPQPTTRPVIASVTPTPAPTRKVGAPDVPQEWGPATKANPWKWIVIHHSATPAGSAGSFDREHRAKGWDELGYHFVIGNGTGSKDGQIEVGSRWPKQKWGAHAKTSSQEYNNFGIGICMVGNFDIDRPTANQTRALAKLVAHLMQTYHIPASKVVGHGETKPTDCPGRNCSVAEIRRMATQMASESSLDARPTQANAELLRPIGR